MQQQPYGAVGRGRRRLDDEYGPKGMTAGEKALLVTGALIGVVLLAGIITWLTLSFTPVWTDQVRGPVNHRVDVLQREVVVLQGNVTHLQEEIDNLPDTNGSATALQLPNGLVLPITNILPGQLLERDPTANQIIGVTPDSVFIITALGYTPENVAHRGVPNGYAELDGLGLVPISELPAAAFVQFFFISNSGQLPSLTTANVGDYAVIFNTTNGTNVVYVLSALPPTDSANWILLTQSSSSGAYVVTVAGPGSPAPLTGPHVLLTNQDLGYPYQQGGNAFGAVGLLGLQDAHPLRLIAGNSTFVILDPGGNVTTFVTSVRLNTVSSALLAADGTGLVKGASLGAGLALAGTTLSNIGVLGVISNSSGIIVAQDANGIWSLLLNVSIPAATTLTAGAGIVVTPTGPSSYSVANSGVLGLISNSSGILVAQDANGIWSLLLNITSPAATNITAGLGISVTPFGPAGFAVANTGIVSLVSNSSGILVAQGAGGVWSVLLNDTDAALTNLTAGSGIVITPTGPNSFTIANSGVLGLVSNSTDIIVAQDANGVWSLLLNETDSAPTNLTAGAGIVVTQTGPTSFTIANSGVLGLVSNSTDIVVAQDANGVWSLLLNETDLAATNLTAGPGIVVTPQGVNSFLVANSGVLALISNSSEILVAQDAGGVWSLLLNVTAPAPTNLTAGAGIVVTPDGPNSFTIANSGVLGLISNDSNILVAQDANGIWSLLLNVTAPAPTNITAGAGIAVTPEGPNSFQVANTGVLGVVSNSSEILVAQEAGGIWSLLLNATAPNVTLVAEPGISITPLGPLAFGVGNTGVLSLFSTSPALVVSALVNGSWSLFLNVSALPSTTVAAGAGISVTTPSPGTYVVANTGLLGANVTGPGLALAVTPDGIAAFTSTALTEVFTYGGGLSSSQNANGTVILSNTGLLGANVTGPGLALSVTPDGIAAFTSTCINEVFTFGSGLTSTQFANGTVILSTTGGPSVASVVATNPLFNSGTSTAVNLTLGLSGVTAGSFTYSSITVDAYGRLTAAASGTAPVTSVAVTSPVTNTGTATAPNIGLVNSGVTAATYTYSTITVTAKGIVTSAASGTAPVASVTATAPLTNTGTATNPVIALSNSGVSPLTYIFSTVSVNAFGLVTSASSGTFLTTSPVTNLGTAQNPNFGLVASGATAGSYSLPTLTVTSTGVVTAISTNANLYFCVYALSGQTITSESDIAFGHISAQSAGWTFSPSSSNIQQATYTGATTRALSISYNVVLLRTGSTGTSVCCFVVVNGSVVGGTDSYCLPASATSTTLNFAMTVTATIALNQATSVACLVDDTYNVVYAQMSTRWT